MHLINTFVAKKNVSFFHVTTWNIISFFFSVFIFGVHLHWYLKNKVLKCLTEFVSVSYFFIHHSPSYRSILIHLPLCLVVEISGWLVVPHGLRRGSPFIWSPPIRHSLKVWVCVWFSFVILVPLCWARAEDVMYFPPKHWFRVDCCSLPCRILTKAGKTLKRGRTRHEGQQMFPGCMHHGMPLKVQPPHLCSQTKIDDIILPYKHLHTKSSFFLFFFPTSW